MATYFLQQILDRFNEVIIVNDSRLMKIQLSEHHIARDEQPFHGMNTAFVDPDEVTSNLRFFTQGHCCDETVKVILSVIHPSMTGISQ